LSAGQEDLKAGRQLVTLEKKKGLITPSREEEKQQKDEEMAAQIALRY
jgi:hypothetical protein